jgi:hypothetical protein
MGGLSWLLGVLSRRSKSLSGYRKGMKKAKKGDFAGAIADYSTTINSSGIPHDVLGMALYNRALAYSALHQDELAATDLTKVLEMRGLPEEISTAARHRRERIRRRDA